MSGSSDPEPGATDGRRPPPKEGSGPRARRPGPQSLERVLDFDEVLVVDAELDSGLALALPPESDLSEEEPEPLSEEEPEPFPEEEPEPFPEEEPVPLSEEDLAPTDSLASLVSRARLRVP